MTNKLKLLEGRHIGKHTVENPLKVIENIETICHKTMENLKPKATFRQNH